MPRRGRRKPLTYEQIKERRRKNRNYQARRRYALKQKSLFYTEYEKLCKKYGCFVQCLYGAHITKQKRGEELYTMSSHLEGVKEGLKD